MVSPSYLREIENQISDWPKIIEPELSRTVQVPSMVVNVFPIAFLGASGLHCCPSETLKAEVSRTLQDIFLTSAPPPKNVTYLWASDQQQFERLQSKEQI